MIQERYEGRDKDKIISIINAEGISDATREWRLNRIDNGRTWKLLKTEYCRYLRKSSVMRIYSSVPEVKAPRRDYLVARTPDIYAATEARISSAVPGATPMDIEEPK